MKITEKKHKDKKPKHKSKPLKKSKKEHVLFVAQEIKFARQLAGNEKKTRDRSLKTLIKWLNHCFQKGYEFKEDDFARIWKGLFYAVWMADKPLVQEDLCENIACILDLFPSDQYKYALLMVKSGFKTLAKEWYGIDNHRMDKFLMLVRRYLRGSLRCVARSSWSEHACKQYAKMLAGTDGLLALKTPLYAKNATSMILHVIECYLEEISKVSQGKIKSSSLSELLRPICQYMCSGDSNTIATACRRLLTELLRYSNAGLQYMEKTRAWEQMGCPEGGPDALELESDEDDEALNANNDELDNESMKALDPRAGRINVVLEPLPVPSVELAAMLKDMLKNTTSKAHMRAKICMQRFEKLAQNEYPLKVSAPEPGHETPDIPRPAAAARSLHALEKSLLTAADELALRGLSRKHRKRLLAKSRAGLSIMEDAMKLKSTQNNAAGDWEVEDTQPATKKSKKDANKENRDKKLKKRKLEKKTSEPLSKKAKLETKTDLNKAKSDIKKNTDKLTAKQGRVNTARTSEDIKKIPEKSKFSPSIIKDVKTEKPVMKNKRTGSDSLKTLDLKKPEKSKPPAVVAKKVKNFQKQLSPKIDKNASIHTPKKVKFVLKNNSMQGPVDYYKSVRQSPNIPFDSTKKPSKTNLKVSTPSPINPFKKKMKLKY